MPKKRPSTPKKLPKGLDEFHGSLVLGEWEYLERLAYRLKDLPEFGLYERLTELTILVRRADAAEVEAKKARRRARDCAEKLWDACTHHWTIKELQQATGYDND